MSAFICHASEDKDDFVRPLAEALREEHIEVWYDEFSLDVGDSLTGSINSGLGSAERGIVILSRHFFAKAWPQQELKTLINRQLAGKANLILPVRHGISHEEVATRFPLLADSISISSDKGVDAVVRALVKKLRPEKSPIVVAREALQRVGVEPPSVTDPFWFDLAEMKESQFHSPYADTKWLFPLPHGVERSEQERGENLASMLLQLDWSNDAREEGLCQLSRPEEIHDFLRRWPGLIETARTESITLALYAPQITIPGFDTGFEDVFDEIVGHDFQQMEYLDYDPGWKTRDGTKPLCHEVIALRHPTFGNFTPYKVAQSFVDAHDMHFRRSSFTGFECLVWLLSTDADWLPAKVRDILLEGFHGRQLWAHDLMIRSKRRGDFIRRLYRIGRRGRSISRAVKRDAVEHFTEALQNIGVHESPDHIADQFFSRGYVESYDAWEDEMRAARSGRTKQGAA